MFLCLSKEESPDSILLLLLTVILETTLVFLRIHRECIAVEGQDYGEDLHLHGAGDGDVGKTKKGGDRLIRTGCGSNEA